MASTSAHPRLPSRAVSVSALACGAADKRPGTRQGLGRSILPVKNLANRVLAFASIPGFPRAVKSARLRAAQPTSALARARA
jgi:hypothetical protein